MANVDTASWRNGSSWDAAGEDGAPVPVIVRFLAIAAVMAALVFNFLLCFVNTRLFPITDAYVMLSEMLVIGTVMLAALTRRAPLYLLLVAFLTYMLLLFALRGGQYNLKSVRDILIPIAFYFTGMRLRDPGLGDRLVLASALVVVAAGLFEYLFVDTFISYFNVLGYYLARGTVSADQLYGQTQGLFISGMRPEPRTILPFLGQHRVSSVFLEPVSMGNFAVIIYSWALYRGRAFAARWWVMALAFTVIALADARFGLYSCVLVTLLYPLYDYIPRPAWIVLPFLMLAMLGIYGIMSGTGGGPNDLSGRFAVTAHILTQLSPGVVFGAEATDQFTADSGLAYTLTAFGLFGFAALWTTFVHAPLGTARAWRFHSMVIVYLLLLMLISDSFYSIKTAALLWFLLGTSNGDRPALEAPAA
ncbi:hypothetical protein [Mesorhizobium sp. SP-1A]|uniref:hypothetical protein n=1 Tax=Mesorhizobium sp. SP-1A TaxID=3077840 RepID=UPI0028F74CD2|nr:hypothetical protein [Mesorhizobium sp. SP-1A]